jgi:hypothetical protein
MYDILQQDASRTHKKAINNNIGKRTEITKFNELYHNRYPESESNLYETHVPKITLTDIQIEPTGDLYFHFNFDADMITNVKKLHIAQKSYL